MRAGARAAAPTLLPWIAATAAAATVAVGLILDARGVPLGVPHPPALGKWDPRAHALLLVSIACFAGAVALAPRLLSRSVSPLAFAAGAFALTLILRLALAAGRSGTGAWTDMFDLDRSFEAKNEYLPALRAFAYGTGFFLDRFAELVPALPVHAAGHPPGLLLVMHWLGIDTAGELAALCIVVGAFGAPLTYLVGRALFEERAARVAALLLALAPGALLYGATSADAVYLTLGLLAAWPLAAGAATRRRSSLAAGAATLAVGSLFAWSLLAVGAWAALVALLRAGWRSALELSIWCAAAVLALYGALAALTGFDAPGAIRATEEVYRLGIASMRPYAYWAFGSPVAFLLVLGLPIAWLAVRALAEASPEAIAVFAVIAIASILGLTKAETERIWLFLAPLVCLAAAPVVARRPAAIAPVAAALAIQALLYELLFDTVW